MEVTVERGAEGAQKEAEGGRGIGERGIDGGGKQKERR